METWSWLGAAVPSREWGLAEQQEFGSGKKKKKKSNFSNGFCSKSRRNWNLSLNNCEERMMHGEKLCLMQSISSPKLRHQRIVVFSTQTTQLMCMNQEAWQRREVPFLPGCSVYRALCVLEEMSLVQMRSSHCKLHKKKKKMHFFLLLQLCLVVFGRSCTAGQMAIACSKVTTGMRFGGIFRLKNRLQPHSSGWWPTLQTKQDIFTTRAANPQSK